MTGPADHEAYWRTTEAYPVMDTLPLAAMALTEELPLALEPEAEQGHRGLWVAAVVMAGICLILGALAVFGGRAAPHPTGSAPVMATSGSPAPGKTLTLPPGSAATAAVVATTRAPAAPVVVRRTADPRPQPTVAPTRTPTPVATTPTPLPVHTIGATPPPDGSGPSAAGTPTD